MMQPGQVFGGSVLCKIEITLATDQALLVNRASFMNRVDHFDLAFRESETIVDAYLESWFRYSDGHVFFTVPAFYLKDGVARFINGRHRTVLLFRHLEIAPMAVTAIPPPDRAVVQEIAASLAYDGDVVDLPDLPILTLAELNAIVERQKR